MADAADLFTQSATRSSSGSISPECESVATFTTGLCTSALRRQPDVDLRSGTSNLPMEICRSQGGGLCGPYRQSGYKAMSSRPRKKIGLCLRPPCRLIQLRIGAG
jgi:hypothetical protein